MESEKRRIDARSLTRSKGSARFGVIGRDSGNDGRENRNSGTDGSVPGELQIYSGLMFEACMPLGPRFVSKLTF